MRRILVATVLFALPAVAGQPTKRPTDAVRGEELYRRHCVSCHGARNGGKGPATAALVHDVPPLQGKVEPNEDNIRAVLRGKDAMPGFEASFDRADAVRVLKYMRSLGPAKALPVNPTRSSPIVTDPKKTGKGRKGPAAKPTPEPADDGPEREGPAED